MADPGGWRINLETKRSREVLRVFSDAIRADETLHSVTPTMNPSNGILRASMTIAESRQGHATEIATAAFYRALATAGLDTERPGWELNIEIVSPLS